MNPKFYDINTLKDKRGVLIDMEYNAMDSNAATKCWCVVTTELKWDNEKKLFLKENTKRWHPKEEGPESYHREFAAQLKAYLEDGKFDFYVGHNYWGAEFYVLRNLIGFTTPFWAVVDTLVLSRLLRPSSPFPEVQAKLIAKGLDTRNGGHSLKAWGKRLGNFKTDFDDFTQFTYAQLDYCQQDVFVNVDILNRLMYEQSEYRFPNQAIEVEHFVHAALQEQRINGFLLDKAMAKKLQSETGKLIEEYLAELHKVFPPEKKLLRTLTPRYVEERQRDANGKPAWTSDDKKTREMVFKTVINSTDKKTLLGNIHEKNEDGSYNLYTMVTFNPNSPQQVGHRLMGLGWNPVKFTAPSEKFPNGQVSTDKAVIGEAIDFLAETTPEVEVLRKFNIVTHRNQISTEWLKLAEGDGKVHGSVTNIGPWTHRMSHHEPNMGNIAKASFNKDGTPQWGLDGNFGYESRACFIPSKGLVQVGCDAEGIQLRALAHYMGDPEYIKTVTTGDVHTVNQHAAGIATRALAKTFAYAWLLGAGDEKIGTIVGVKPDEYAALFERAKGEKKFNRFRDHQRNKAGKQIFTDKDCVFWWVIDRLRIENRKVTEKIAATIIKGFFTKKQFLDNTPALKRFKEVDIKEAAAEGYVVGLDGRKIWVPNEHFAMGGYLQGFEAVVMKHAMYLWQNRLNEKGIYFKQLALVHDEYQIECHPENAEEVGETMAWAIKEAGVQLGSKCPLSGAWKKGDSWASCH